jgi:tagatose-1,6-bisphosphate aldolase non-catalytic subunit AgaZ/GatZ
LRINVYVPLVALRVSVTGEALVTVVEDELIPEPVVTVHVPPETESVEVGSAPALPSRVIVTDVEVPVEYPAVTIALDGEADEEIIE